MACIDHDGLQSQSGSAGFKHYCRVCKKGFMCGRALGGHMRAHGIGDDSGTMDDDDDDQASDDWEDNKNDNGGVKRMYQLRANPNRLKSVRVCENCGKEFFSWKSFLEHGKCSSDDAESLVSSPAGSDDGDEDFGRSKGQGWSKRKRSMRTKVGGSFGTYSSEDEDILLAKCLIDLANARVDTLYPPAVAEEAESSASAEERRNPLPTAAFLAPLVSRPRVALAADKAKGITTPKGLFECKACKKVFTSHQALGGHRASHKKVKGCYAAKQDQIDNYNNSLLGGGGDDLIMPNDQFSPSSKTSSYQFEHAGASRKKQKDHECSICHRVFSTGQALGGHKRCHWITTSNSYTPKFHFNDERSHQKSEAVAAGPLDLNLNLPAHGADDVSAGIRRDPRNPLSFEVSTDIHLRPLSTLDTIKGHPNNNDDNNDYYNNDNNIMDIVMHDKVNNYNKKVADDVVGVAYNKNIVVDDDDVDEEADSKLELAKISGINKEMSSIKGANASPWLQVGIGSTAEVGADS